MTLGRVGCAMAFLGKSLHGLLLSWVELMMEALAPRCQGLFFLLSAAGESTTILVGQGPAGATFTLNSSC